MKSLSDPRRRWLVAEHDEASAERVSQEFGLSMPVSRVLVARGVADTQAVRCFLEPAREGWWSDPELLPGMQEAADAIAAAVRRSARIVVFGDFDVDGVSAAAVMALGLKAFGGSGTVIVPNRFSEGYGLMPASVDRILASRPDLVVTVDCGVSAAAEIAMIRAAGVEVVVTDHHEPGLTVPAGVPIVDPKLKAAGDVVNGHEHPFSELAGAGVALKVIAAVGARLGLPDAWRELTDLAMLGTIADIVPLIDENRALAADGLRRARELQRPGLAALAAVAGTDIASLTSQRVGFALGPRLNAAGRMVDPRESLELLLACDIDRASDLAAALEAHNRQRQLTEQELFDEAIQLAERSFCDGDRVLVLAGEGWHDGVKGIVASRLASRFGVPVLLFRIEDGEARGSGRSVAGVDLFEVVSSCSEMMTRFGGHRSAVGAALPAERLDAFREALVAAMAALPDEAFISQSVADAYITLADVTPDLVRSLDVLEPCGSGNPTPVFAVADVRLRDATAVGRDGTHLRFTAVDQSGTSLPAIAFRCRDIASMVSRTAPLTLLAEVAIDDYRGGASARLVVRDFAEETTD